MTTPNNLAHKALERAKREEAAQWARVAPAVQDVETVLTYWSQDYGIEDFNLAVQLTDITIHKIIMEEQ